MRCSGGKRINTNTKTMGNNLTLKLFQKPKTECKQRNNNNNNRLSVGGACWLVAGGCGRGFGPKALLTYFRVNILTYTHTHTDRYSDTSVSEYIHTYA